jgi:hypothetical protein
MKRTLLNLLTSDGAIAVAFSDILSPEQYESVYECVAAIGDADEMRKCINELAAKWGIAVIIDRA